MGRCRARLSKPVIASVKTVLMSAYGPDRTWPVAPHASACEAKANTRSRVTVAAVNVHTQATDAQGIVRDLKPLLTNDLYTQPFNYGPN